jgi:hypothetical protein
LCGESLVFLLEHRVDLLERYIDGGWLLAVRQAPGWYSTMMNVIDRSRSAYSGRGIVSHVLRIE